MNTPVFCPGDLSSKGHSRSPGLILPGERLGQMCCWNRRKKTQTNTEGGPKLSYAWDMSEDWDVVAWAESKGHENRLSS